ncbi:hypothetical protein O9992_23720 [Vibrio lentus]|nr:hypothetical protein [Vibrio lentus]
MLEETLLGGELKRLTSSTSSASSLYIASFFCFSGVFVFYLGFYLSSDRDSIIPSVALGLLAFSKALSTGSIC